jgi:hypothetical protein
LDCEFAAAELRRRPGGGRCRLLDSPLLLWASWTTAIAAWLCAAANPIWFWSRAVFCPRLPLGHWMSWG